MSAITLKKPMTEGGIRTINFFNGRMLSGEDLTQEQSANREARLRLGQTIGEGIAHGLEVRETPSVSTKTSPVVTVTGGLAINRAGQTLALAADTDVSLIRSLNGAAASSTTAVFAECKPPQSGVYIAGAGVYLLTMAPAAAGEGRAPVSGLGNVAAACNTRYTVEGVQFRLLQLDLTLAELDDTPHLRNLVAYKCFGVEDVKNFFGNPLGPAIERYGLLDTLRPSRLTDCEIPLAILHWTTTGGIEFIDTWAVRRRVTTPVVAGRWSILVGDRYNSEAEARVLQFAEHVDRLRATRSDVASIAATRIFQYLPPFGILPLGGGATPGFNYQQFFSPRRYRNPVFLEGARVEQLFRTSLLYPPIDLRSGEMLWLYLVRESQDPRARADALPPPYLIFTSGYVPFLGEARFNVARWNYSNAV